MSDLHVRNVTQRFRLALGEVHAVDDVSFSVAQGKFIGLVGPSGCGKSSLLLMIPWKTALENVEFPLKLRGVPQAQRQAKAIGMLELVGLKDFVHRFPHELSGGMKQRVSIARGFCQDPDLLLMDEPFAALDEQTRMTLGDELLAIWERHKKTAVFVTHSLTEAVYLCDEVIIMGARPGRILRRLEIDLPRPRTYTMMATERFGQLRNEIWELIRMGHGS